MINWKRYAFTYLACMIGLMVLGALLTKLLGIRMPTGVSSVAPPALAAMFEGLKRADAGLPAPAGKPAWMDAGVMTGVVAAITVIVLIASMFIEPVRMTLQRIPPQMILTVFVATMLITLLLNWFFYGIGYKRQKRMIDKRAANS